MSLAWLYHIAGYSVSDLRMAGFNAGQLKDVNYSPSQLISGGFRLDELKPAGYKASDFQAAGFDASDLKKAGFIASQLISAGFDINELKQAGYDANDLKAGGFGAYDLKTAGFAASQLIASGFYVADLRHAGYDAADFKAAGFAASQLVLAGFCMADLNHAGFDVLKVVLLSGETLLPDELVEPTDYLECLFTRVEEMLQKSCRLVVGDRVLDRQSTLIGRCVQPGGSHEIVAIVKSAVEFREEFVNSYQPRNFSGLRQLAGYDVAELVEAGFTDNDIQGLGYSIQQWKDAFPNCTARLKEAGYTCAQLKQGGFTAKQLKDAGVSATELRECGSTASQLREIGYGLHDLVCFNALELKQAGFTAKHFTTEELIGAH